MKTRHIRSRVLAAALVVVTAWVLVPSTFARIARNTIDPHARLSHNGTRIRLTGPIEATVGEWVQQRVTITQRSTGAIATGFIHFRATGEVQRWEVIAHAEGGAKFLSGPATAVGMARTLSNGKPTDAHQWLVTVTLQNH